MHFKRFIWQYTTRPPHFRYEQHFVQEQPPKGCLTFVSKPNQKYMLNMYILFGKGCAHTPRASESNRQQRIVCVCTRGVFFSYIQGQSKVPRRPCIVAGPMQFGPPARRPVVARCQQPLTKVKPSSPQTIS